jgi:hypothetical protein
MMLSIKGILVAMVNEAPQHGDVCTVSYYRMINELGRMWKEAVNDFI